MIDEIHWIGYSGNPRGLDYYSQIIRICRVDPLNYFRRKSLFTTLLVVVCLLAGLSVIAAFSNWRLLENVGQTQIQFSSRSLPLVSAAQSMAAQSAAIALLAPQIPTIENASDLDSIYRQIDDHLELMKSIPGRIESISAQSDGDSEPVASRVADIEDWLGKMRVIVEQRLRARQKLEMSVAQIRQLLAELRGQVDGLIAEQSDSIFALTDDLLGQAGQQIDEPTINRLLVLNLDSEVLHQLNRNLTEIENLVERLSADLGSSQALDIKTRIDFQLRSLIGNAVSLSSAASARSLGVDLNWLYNQLQKTDNVVALQQEMYTINLELIEIFGLLQNDVYALNSLTRDLVRQVEVTTLQTAVDANQTVQTSGNISLGIAILSLLISVFAIWWFVIRRIMQPLQELTGLLRQISRNQLDVEIKNYSLVELDEIAFALEVFRNNSRALADHQQTLQDNNRQLSRVNQDLNAFVHVASHDLKSPLHGIRVLSDFIVQDMKDREYRLAQTNLGLLKKRIDRMENLIESLLGYTQAGNRAEQVDQIDVAALAKESFELVVSNENFDLQLPDEVLNCQAVTADLTIIFINLFDNAVSHHDGDSGSIALRYTENDQEYVFEISDDGPGIPAQYHQQIFEVLKTLKSRDRVEGSGVGLAHVKRLLESRGGSIQVFSDPQTRRGARFVIRYPKLEQAA